LSAPVSSKRFGKDHPDVVVSLEDHARFTNSRKRSGVPFEGY
jgi:hypothetical protein